MKKHYLYTIILFIIFSFSSFAQGGKSTINHDSTIDGLSFYPNPATNGKIFIASKSNTAKEIAIYDVLGKKVFQTLSSAKEINISSLTPGVYIIKIKEDDSTATRKLIIK
ncbi:T9SS type A sorting domain-containing protein [Flavobacterium ardleyense]|uniref:T9SS type A sorting domain-containing protein n=1 Tax=Flavobacterium ardleyense TaxID=2038737 RepID=UPI00298D261E|nr:T9SS type A sorting domain-containing protein [Flavobacterium ardleyense]